MTRSNSNRRTAKPTDNRQYIFIALGLVAVVAMAFTVKGILGSGSSTTANTASTTAQQQGGVKVINMKVSAAGYAPKNSGGKPPLFLCLLDKPISDNVVDSSEYK